jgi:tRNA pseudouridine38-40 synthase
VRVKAVVAYDGTDYKGFQLQKDVPTVQGELERALRTLTTQPTRVLAAGRTDAGVHAEGQVVAFDTDWRHGLSDLHRGMNAMLPEAVAVWRLQQASPEFHPRFDACQRAYRYTIYQGPVRNPLVSRYSLYIRQKLDVSAMQAAAQALLGVQDFAAFGSPPQGESTVREVFVANWRADDDWLYFDVEANAFLYRMVRILVGTMLRVGYGAVTVDEFTDVLRAAKRKGAGPAVAAKGLTLKAVYYPA